MKSTIGNKTQDVPWRVGDLQVRGEEKESVKIVDAFKQLTCGNLASQQ